MENVNFIFFKKGQVYTTQCFQSVDSCIFIIILCIFLFFFSNETFIKEMFYTLPCKFIFLFIMRYIELYLFLKYLLAVDLIFSVIFEESDCALCYFLVTFSCIKPWFHDSLLHKHV